MDEERDLVVFEDDAGNELTMEVLDYLAYEGKEYALLTEYVEDDEDGEGESELIDPREYWYLESLTMDGDAIVASVYCYVGPGHHEFQERKSRLLAAGKVSDH